MPNWVYNNLSIAPTYEHKDNPEAIADVERLISQVGATYTIRAASYASGTFEVRDVEVTDPGLSFWNIVRPEGEDSKKYEESIGASGAMPFWYDWNVENWGTKWDASDVSQTFHEEGKVEYSFSTPWSAPLPALVALSAQYPRLEISLDWEEEQGFGGTFRFEEGEAYEIDYYDTPSCHREYVERGRECACDYEGPIFEDCPRDVDTSISPDELEIEAMV